MSEQQTHQQRQTRDTSPLPIAGARDVRARKPLEDRCEAVRRWIDEDDDACCRGID